MQNLKIILPYNLNTNVRLFANELIFLTIIILFLNINILKIKENISKQIVSKNLIFNSFDYKKVINKDHTSIFKNTDVLKHSLVGVANKDKKSIVVQETGKVKSAKPKQVKKTFTIISIVKSVVIIKEVPDAKFIPKASPKSVEMLLTPALPKAVEQPKVNTDGLFPAKKAKSDANVSTGSNKNFGDEADETGRGEGNEEQNDGNVVKGGTYKKKLQRDSTGGGFGKVDEIGGVGRGNGKPSLSLSKRTWKSLPKISDDSDETGIIKFRIKIDADGDLVDVIQIESTVSPALTQQYRRALLRTKFKPTSDGDKPEITTAIISFRLSPR